MAFEFTDNNFEEKTSTGVSVVDFWAEWCGPCRIIAPIIDELSSEYDGKALVGKLNVDHNPDVSYRLGVRSIPTIMVFKDGELYKKQVGTTTKKALADMIDGALNAVNS